MPPERVSMKKIRDVLRLTHTMGMSRRKVSEATGIGRTAVSDYVQRAVIAGLAWPLPEGLDDAGLERRLYPPSDAYGIHATASQVDFPQMAPVELRQSDSLALLSGRPCDSSESQLIGGTMSDIRTARRGEMILDAIVARNSLVLRTIDGGRAGEVAVGRYLDSDGVTFTGILQEASRRTIEAARGRPVLAIQDTTEINFAGRAARRTNLGPTNDSAVPGFYCHPTLLVDIEHEAVLGIARAEIWTRTDDDAETKPHRHKRAVRDKESGRWLNATVAAADLTAVTDRVVVVADREGDMYAHFSARPPGVPMKDVVEIRVPPRGPGDKGRVAYARVAAGTVEIERPKNAHADTRAATDKTLALGYIDVREVEPPAGTAPICSRLLTTLAIATREDVAEVVRLYRLRWRIEQLFRSLKSDGLDFEATQVTDAARLFKLAALGLVGAARTMQLVDARDGSPRPATDVVDAAEVPAVTAISKALEGATARQKNPHAQGSLAFVAWVAARLGGWTGYYKPPGPKAMAAGWRRLTERLEGFALAAALHRSGNGRDV